MRLFERKFERRFEQQHKIDQTFRAFTIIKTTDRGECVRANERGGCVWGSENECDALR